MSTAFNVLLSRFEAGKLKSTNLCHVYYLICSFTFVLVIFQFIIIDCLLFRFECFYLVNYYGISPCGNNLIMGIKYTDNNKTSFNVISFIIISELFYCSVLELFINVFDM